jgi:hypothetical protein
MADLRADDQQVRQGFFRRLGARLHDSVPDANIVLFGSAIWGVLMAISAVASIWTHNGLLIASPLAVIGVYFYGGSLGFAPGLMLAALLFGQAKSVTRFIGGTLAILLATHTATAGVFALQYRVFYSHWHAAFPNIIWFFQFAFTSAGAIYQYSVDSIYYYWPFSLLCFLGFGLWFARTSGHKPH